MQKSWMWQSNSAGVEGATIDVEENRIFWFDEPGCACGDSSMVQTIDDFVTNGLRYLSPPDDVLEEMQTFVSESKVKA